MKIVYVDYEYHYGKKELGYNDIGITGFIKSLASLGHEVIPFFYDELTHNKTLLNKSLKDFCSEKEPDLVFFLLAHDVFEFDTISEISKTYTTVNFFGDDHWRFDSFTKKLAHAFSYCVTTDVFALEKYQDIGYSNVILSQWAALDHSIGIVESDDYIYDVSFVGGKNTYRSWFVKYLKKNGINVECFGVGWENGTVSLDEMQNIFLKSKINLNISNSISYDLRFLFSDPIGFLRQLRSTKSSSQIKARNYEIPAFNGFQLTDFVPFLDDSFNIGTEIVCYSNPDESIDLIRYYLENDVKREEIKRKSREVVLNNHLYINRIENILDSIKH